MRERTSLKSIVDIVATTLVIASSLAVLLRIGVSSFLDAPEASATSKSADPSTTPAGAARSIREAAVPFEPSDTIGSLDAKIAMVEYVDFECSFCARFAEDTWPTIHAEYVMSGKVLMVFKQLPLQSHPNARQAAASALCAAEQGRLADMHDGLFRRQPQLDSSTGQALARSLGLRREQFDACSKAAGAVIDEHIKTAEAVGITGTPSFVLGRIRHNQSIRTDRVLVGAQSLHVFREALDDLLASAAP